jgi:polyisoprenoid-binding protein YceI
MTSSFPRRRESSFALLLFILAFAATAAERPLDPTKSEIGFSVKQMGVAVSGKFTRFTARIDLDPAKLESASAEVKVDIGSIDTGSEEGDETAKDKPWLDAAGFPQATFKSTSLRSLGGDRYEMKGTLAIRGKPREIAVPLTLKKQPDGSSVATGEFQIRRTDFGIGGGEWNDGDLVGNEVPVHFRLTLKEHP